MTFINSSKIGLMTFVLMLGLTLSVAALEISDLDNPKVTEAFIDGLVGPLMKENHSPSGVVSIIKDGKLLFSKGYGFHNIEKQIKADPATSLFRIASISKLFTYVSVMQLVEQGKLDLDTDINTYLKTFQIDDTFPGEPITMRHIMTHTAGFEDGGVGSFAVADENSILPLVEAIKRYPRVRVNAPGKQTSYSNYAISVAGLIVENISGTEFNTYVQHNIFDVLGMESTSFQLLPENLKNHIVVEYTYAAGVYKPKPAAILTNIGPAGSAYSTATDMAIFAQTILNHGEYEGARILKTETAEQMLTRSFSHDERLMGMALGFYETEHNGIRLLGHGGDLENYHADLGIDIANNLAFFIDFSGVGGRVVRSALAPALYKTFNPVNYERLSPPTDFTDRAAKYAGEYRFWRSNFSQVQKAFSLPSTMTITPTASNTLLFTAGENSREFVEIEDNLFQQVGEGTKLAFQENSEKEVTGLVVDGLPFMSLFKTPFYFSSAFNINLLGLAMLMFVGVILKLLFQWRAHRELQGHTKQVVRSAVITSVTNITFVLTGLVVVTITSPKLMFEIPLVFKLWLWIPIIATLAGIYHAYNAVIVWKEGLLAGKWARVRYSLVAAGALFMIWFYYFWNLLGFHYYS